MPVSTNTIFHATGKRFRPLPSRRSRATRPQHRYAAALIARNQTIEMPY